MVALPVRLSGAVAPSSQLPEPHRSIAPLYGGLLELLLRPGTAARRTARSGPHDEPEYETDANLS